MDIEMVAVLTLFVVRIVIPVVVVFALGAILAPRAAAASR
jgi:hypothetical protein